MAKNINGQRVSRFLCKGFMLGVVAIVVNGI